MATATPTLAPREHLPHPVLRATALSSAIGLLAGLVLGLVTQIAEHDGP